ncbi:MAG: hypothetical protein KGL90_10005 [Burkholderiales bacterium]|nr:hypothetical protein [Burkholderiales bacterium]
MNESTGDTSAIDHHHHPGQSLAVMAEALYLANLLVAPGIAFVVLLWLWFKHKDSAPLLARQHLLQATCVSVVAGMLIVCLSTALVALGGLRWPWTWVAVTIYLVCVHGMLVLFGVFALAKAMAGQVWRYPIIGPRSV